MPNLRTRIARFLFGDVIAAEARSAAAAVSARVDDSPGWDALTSGPNDRPWAERTQDLEDALEAWRKNFLVRRIVTLTRSYVVAGGITVSSAEEDVEAFTRRFWQHPKNHLESRLGPLCDELTRAGEVFPVLFTNRVDGMSYVRLIPARLIHGIETDPEDYETELAYEQLTADATPKAWIGRHDRRAFRAYKSRKPYPLMLHYAVNRPLGATRGEGDLTPLLPWARRYTEWLKDRVRLNRQRTRAGVLDIEVSDDSLVEAKRRKVAQQNPLQSGAYVHGPGETVTMHKLEIGAGDASDDGKMLRLAAATGANVALHYLGEGEAVNYASAQEMGEPTTRFFAERQGQLVAFLLDLTAVAYRRYVAVTQKAETRTVDYTPHALGLTASTLEVARDDNESLARAAGLIVGALRELKEAGWIDDETAVRMAFKFAGEPLGDEQVREILGGEG